MDMFEGLTRKSAKPFNVWVYGTSRPAIDGAIRQLEARGIPAHDDLDAAIHALGCAAEYARVKARPSCEAAPVEREGQSDANDLIVRVRQDARASLTELESKRLVCEAGIPVVASSLAVSPSEAVRISQDLGFPVVLKIASPDVLHKSDAGGVRVGLSSAAEVENAYAEILAAVQKTQPDARVDGISVQKMVRPGVEVIAGMSRDPQFGPTIMFGLGGVLTEVLNDVSFRVAPIDRRSAGEMIREIKGFPLLQGYRGSEPVDLDALESVLVKLSRLVQMEPDIKELDLNPVIASSDDAVVVDARVILTPAT